MSAGVPTCQIIIRIGFITVSGRDIEPNLPDKRTVLIPVFQHLSSRLGKERVIWRYDPILLNGRYTAEYHVKAFEEIAGWLDGYTEKVAISFVDLYAKAKRNLRGLEVREPGQDEMVLLAETIPAGMAAGIAMRISVTLMLRRMSGFTTDNPRYCADM